MISTDVSCVVVCMRPSKPEDQRKVKVTLSLDKHTYENAKRRRLNVSRFCNSALQIYLGNAVEDANGLGGIIGSFSTHQKGPFEPPASCTMWPFCAAK